MAKSLDRNRDHCIVYSLPGVAFEQDGAFFDVNGAEVVDYEEVEEPSRKPVTKYDVESQRSAGKRGGKD